MLSDQPGIIQIVQGKEQPVCPSGSPWPMTVGLLEEVPLL